MAKRLNKQRSTKLIDTTSKLYSRVCSELGYSIEKLLIQRTYPVKAGGITEDQYREKKEKIDDLYCQYLSDASTEILEDLLDAHVTNQIKRAPRTIDIVQKELLERVVNEDNKGNIS